MSSQRICTWRRVGLFGSQLSTRMTGLAASWQSAKVVRTREKVSFFFGVMNLVISALMFGMAPQYVMFSFHSRTVKFTRHRWMHIWYTVQGCYLLPLRFYQYKKRAWHYFLFDLCYYVTILNFIFIWFLPSNPSLFVACYCLSHGSLASAVITWRNSLVFHDQDKVTSLFVHIYAPLSFTVIRYAKCLHILSSGFLIYIGISIPMPQSDFLHSMPSRTYSQSGLYC